MKIDREYKRSCRSVSVMRRIEVARITHLKRRVFMRCRELGKSIRLVAAENGYSEYHIYNNLIRAEKTGEIPYKLFSELTESLRMDDVDGWTRPLPGLVPRAERIPLAYVLDERVSRELEIERDEDGISIYGDEQRNVDF